MKKVILPVLLAFILLSYSTLSAQGSMIYSFDNFASDTNFVSAANIEGGNSYLHWQEDTADKALCF